VGYTGVPLVGVPFDSKKGVIPNSFGRVTEDENLLVGQYAVGWIKRGANGIIGTNKPDSIESAKTLVADAQAEQVWSPDSPLDNVPTLLALRGVRYTTFADWQKLDALETAAGVAQNRPRVKFTSIEDMLHALNS
jgi:ferredoxin--NADP+ reductase